MQLEYERNSLEVVIGSIPHDNYFQRPFENDIIEFLNTLGVCLLKDQSARQFPDLMKLGFFCRSANIKKYLQSYGTSLVSRVGRGLCFHVAPSNVPVNWCYSLIVGLLSGCGNIVRLPNKKFEQNDLLLTTLSELLSLNKFLKISKLICLVRYSHEESLNIKFSKLADVRIIWGGDNTISQFKKFSTKPRCKDINFSDRESACVIFCGEEGLHKCEGLAQDFYNDSFVFDQLACSSPYQLYWVGTKHNVERFYNEFKSYMDTYVGNRYVSAINNSMNKLHASSLMFAQNTSADFKVDTSFLNFFCIDVEGCSKPSDLARYRTASGFFVSNFVDNLSELKKILIGDIQTLSYYGANPDVILDLVIGSHELRVDRVVPVGKALDFDLIWDGYDLISELTRFVTIK